MKESQAEIKAIQAKLQALQSGRKPAYQYSPPSQVHVPQRNGSASATLASSRPDNFSVPIEVLPQRPASQLQIQQLNLKPPRVTSAEQIAEEIKRLEAQAELVNQLSIAQEVALLELRAIAERLERDRQTLPEDAEEFSSEIPVCEYLTEVVPCVEREPNGAFIITTRTIDLFKAEREATLMAQSLRYRAGRPGSASPQKHVGVSRRRAAEPELFLEMAGVWGKLLWQRLSKLTSQLIARRRKASKASRNRAAPIAVPSFSLPDAVIWVIGSTIARVGINLVLASFPGLWLPIVALILTPAAIAIYQIAVSPEAGSIWGYRLFLVMAGLLIGGKLL
ncbi:hypothetical protein H6F93_16550 [Leptolyngbya sp. FACHB-671]|uniref:hypothetical protein n=1 Tax=Leptolyngbya sp. FACHB-671 TaxID=2692812 RepID=UPI0016890FA4|nr:hypothetical protein [Leptolyngbya sp. FACHB-671]MBD2069105.1 hypothetical protein [Leptolyngbya sp. FACHB-671]